MERYHSALDEFSRGNAEPVKALYSRREDVPLANPFGPAVRGWDEVSEALDFASGKFRDGEVTAVDTLASYVGSDLASVLEVERWRAKVGGRDEVSPWVLRVTTTFRNRWLRRALERGDLPLVGAAASESSIGLRPELL